MLICLQDAVQMLLPWLNMLGMPAMQASINAPALQMHLLPQSRLLSQQLAA
jgi:hypothetical protein